MQESLTWLGEEIERFYGEVGELRVAPEVDPATIRAHLEHTYDLKTATPLAEVLSDVAAMMRRWHLHVTHPRYFGYFNPSVTPASIMGDALTATYNPQLAVWAHSPIGNEIERHVLNFFMSRFGFDADAGFANFTSGGAEANHTAVLVALTARFPEFGERGWAALGARPRMYVSRAVHDSFGKVAHATGIGRGAIGVIATDENDRMIVEELVKAIAADREAGCEPTLVVASAGTTSAGVIDPLDNLADVCREQQLWLHVDAAWGGAAILSHKLRGSLAGIERADSITFDAHKWLSVPMGAGMFFCRHREPVLEAFRIETAYMPRSTEGTDDPYSTTMQWTRRCTGLKVFVSLAERGADGYEAMIDHQAAMGDLLRERLRSEGWTILNETPLPTVCFVHPSIAGDAAAIRRVADAVVARGKAWISDGVCGGRSTLRACITSFRTQPADIEILLDELCDVVSV